MQFDPTAFVADPELFTALAKNASSVDCQSDRVLFEQGESAVGLYILQDGTATMSIRSDGDTVMKVDIGAGSLLGLPGLIGNQPYSMTAIARKDANVLFITREDFNIIMEANPGLSFKILQVLAAEVRTARRALYD